jgi:CelD/BcsL family acetyltransferase involved in cellulose biosynthesis
VVELAGSHDFDAAYNAVLEIERSSWKHEHGTAITAVSHQSGFYRDLCRGALSSGRLHLQWLTLDGKPVAYNLGYVRNASYHYLKTSYDAKFRQLSPATYLRARLIASLIERGVRHFDFPGEPYEWEAQWTDSIRWRKVITVYRRTLRGRMLALLDRLRHRRSRARTVRHVDPRAAGRSA